MGYWDGQDDSALLNSPEELANAVAGVSRLQHGTGAVGSIFPPRLAGGTSIPVVTGLRVASVSSLNGTTNVTLQWFEPTGTPTPATYNVYVKRMVGNNQAPQLVASSASPSQFTFQTDAINQVVFIVQTVLQNGQTSPVAASPTCTVTSVSPTLTPASISTQQVVVTGLTLTNASPSAGNVAWSACTVYYNGSAYAVSSGNTTGSNAFIYWTVGGGTFTQASSYTPGPTVFLIATNNAGTSDTAWNKVAAHHIQEANLNFSLLTGQQIQPVVTFLTPSDNDAPFNVGGATGTASTTILSTTGDGVHTGGGLLQIAVRGARPVAGGLVYPEIDIQIQVDAQTAQTIRLLDEGTTSYTQSSLDLAARSEPTNPAGPLIVFQIGIGFTSSLVVNYLRKLTVGGTCSAGQWNITLAYCTKTT